MADLGTIGRCISKAHPMFDGTITGVVADNLAQPAKHRVLAINAASGALSGGAWSDPATGSYTIDISPAYGKTPHVVIEQTPDGSENARVFDNVIPL